MTTLLTTACIEIILSGCGTDEKNEATETTTYKPALNETAANNPETSGWRSGTAGSGAWLTAGYRVSSPLGNWTR